MLARYLGSKQAIMAPLLGVIREYSPPGSHVVDAFSGSLAVSMGLKQAGYKVTANDINLFSSVLAAAYLVPNTPPDPDLRALTSEGRANELGKPAALVVAGLLGKPGYGFLAREDWRASYTSFVALQLHLQTLDQSLLAPAYRRTDIFDSYCEDGANSAFISSRGSTGRRRFFSPANAQRMDLMLNQIRQWTQEGSIDAHSRALLLATLLRAVEKISNTQGTYHDFPRDKWDSRALKGLVLEPPALDQVVAGIGGHAAGVEQDSLSFVPKVGEHSLLYLDPPYNFRQYTAYYFLPNVLCRYPDIDDLDRYFGKLAFVRGQNPEDDFSSSFCRPASFVNDLRALIESAKCDRVMISYFNGKNHWSKFDSGPSDYGQSVLEGLLQEDLFEQGSLNVSKVPRRNYASYGGFKARTVDELILTATIRKTREHASTGRPDHGLQSLAGREVFR